MNKQLEQQIRREVTAILGRGYADRDLHSDDIDNAALAVAEKLGVSEDDVRYAADLPG